MSKCYFLIVLYSFNSVALALDLEKGLVRGDSKWDEIVKPLIVEKNIYPDSVFTHPNKKDLLIFFRGLAVYDMERKSITTLKNMEN